MSFLQVPTAVPLHHLNHVLPLLQAIPSANFATESTGSVNHACDQKDNGMPTLQSYEIIPSSHGIRDHYPTRSSEGVIFTARTSPNLLPSSARQMHEYTCVPLDRGIDCQCGLTRNSSFSYNDVVHPLRSPAWENVRHFHSFSSTELLPKLVVYADDD